MVPLVTSSLFIRKIKVFLNFLFLPADIPCIPHLQNWVMLASLVARKAGKECSAFLPPQCEAAGRMSRERLQGNSSNRQRGPQLTSSRLVQITAEYRGVAATLRTVSERNSVSSVSGLAFYCCGNIHHKLSGFRQYKFIILHSGEQKSWVLVAFLGESQQGWFLLETLKGRSVLLPFSACIGHLCPWARGAFLILLQPPASTVPSPTTNLDPPAFPL